eukprot:10485577-Lingulodinium_polyedra.AAC.1
MVEAVLEVNRNGHGVLGAPGAFAAQRPALGRGCLGEALPAARQPQRGQRPRGVPAAPADSAGS